MKQINFDNLPQNYVLMTHLPYGKVMEVLDRLYKATVLDSFYVRISAPFTRCYVQNNGVPRVPVSLRIDFENGSLCQTGNLSGLLALLSEYTYDLVYKTDKTGYTVDGLGFILNSWELDEGMC